jgi:DNA-3-methyladenine glycosylase II
MDDAIACRFDKNNFHSICDILAAKDADLKNVLQQHGYPPLWMRKPSFATMILIVLEQQVSLASAKSAFLKLRNKIGTITPPKLFLLSDAELKACYFSRQKIVYSKELAKAVITRQLSFKKIRDLPPDEIRRQLTNIKGIGNWTTDIFLMMCLQHADVFPAGDIALIKSVKEVKRLPHHTSTQEIISIADSWKPYRTVAAFILYHAYLTKRNRTG